MLTRVIALLEKDGLVNDSNREIITFGIIKIISTSVMLLFTVCVSLLMGDFLVGILFELCFIMLRRYAGGYHAETQRKCLIMTYLSTLLCVAIIFFLPVNPIFQEIMVALFNICIILKAPVESKNKPLNAVEKKVYKRKAIVISLFLSMLFECFIVIKTPIYSKTIFVVFLLVFLGMLNI